MHRIIDSDGDGLASLNEGLAYVRALRKSMSSGKVSKILTSMDSDSDGRISIQELQDDLENWNMEEDDKEEMKETLQSKFSSYDTDRDGLLDAEELPILYAWLFDFRKADKNDDGALTTMEFRKAAGPWKTPWTSGKFSSEDKEVFHGLDTNGDKRLSEEEYWTFKSGTYVAEQALRTLFRVADADQDERLSGAELAELRYHEPRQKLGEAAQHLRNWARHEGVLRKDGEL